MRLPQIVISKNILMLIMKLFFHNNCVHAESEIKCLIKKLNNHMNVLKIIIYENISWNLDQP